MNIDQEIKDLLEKTVELFQERKISKRVSERIQRGRAVSIASEFEERFAILLERVLPANYLVLIDYPISYTVDDRKRRKTSYPDIAIVRNTQELVGIIELKIDLGYLKRGWVEKANSDFELLRTAGKATYKTDIGTPKAKARDISVARDLRRAVIVLTGANDHKRLLAFRERQENCYVLCSKDNRHPNDYSIDAYNRAAFLEKVFSDPQNQQEWQNLGTFLHDSFA